MIHFLHNLVEHYIIQHKVMKHENTNSSKNVYLGKNQDFIWFRMHVLTMFRSLDTRYQRMLISWIVVLQ